MWAMEAIVRSLLRWTILPAALLALASTMHAGDVLPPPNGTSEPLVEAKLGEDGIWHQSWFAPTFLDLKEEHAEAKAKGRRFAVIFEQRGCIYCTKMHTEVLAKRYINDYVRENFHIVQIDLWGSREATDFDGQKMPEKKLAERWGVMFTPTIVFFNEDLVWGAPAPVGIVPEARLRNDGQPKAQDNEVARMQLGIGADTFYDMFVWVSAKVYKQDRNFQRFHIARHNEREATAKPKPN